MKLSWLGMVLLPAIAHAQGDPAPTPDPSPVSAPVEPQLAPASSQAMVQPAPAPSLLYGEVTLGIGYASLSESRPDAMSSTNASEVSAAGGAIQLYGGIGAWVTPTIAIGGAIAVMSQISPSIDYKLLGAGTPVVNDGGALGGVIGPMAAFRVKENIELNAVIGYGAFGRSSPSPGFGGSGVILSVGAGFQIPIQQSRVIVVIEARLTAGVFSYQDAQSEGTYTSTLLMPTVMGGISFR